MNVTEWGVAGEEQGARGIGKGRGQGRAAGWGEEGEGEGDGEEERGHLAVCCAFTVSSRVHDIRACMHACMHTYTVGYTVPVLRP